MCPHTMGLPSPTKDHRTASLWCMFVSRSLYFIQFFDNTPRSHRFPSSFYLFALTPITPCSTQAPSLFLLFMSPGTHAQQAFRTEPRNQTVRMGATAVLKCEVLRASGIVQWAKDGLLLGPKRSLPGFPRYSMIGKGGKQEKSPKCGSWSSGSSWTDLK